MVNFSKEILISLFKFLFMKFIKTIIPVLLVLLPVSMASFSQGTGNIPDEIVMAIKSGNSKSLAQWFNSNVELVILDKEDIYSRSQAEMICKDFFATHKPVDYKVLFEGGKEGARYSIGNLTTSNGTFRVYFLLKKQDNQSYIHQFRIETENK